ncbi:MAG: AraC family transcriptional regulator [Pikeienuella sp.]|uniref:AraC family transcriptional regulator n=1 Tax=Pikeienuella sp. TaxID=2831957 RepID=UPI00391B454F
MLDRERVFTARCADEAGAFLAAKNLFLSAPSPRAKSGDFAAFNTIYAPGLYLSCIRYGAAVEISAPAERGDYGLAVPLEGASAATGENGFEACTGARTILASPGRPQRSRFGAGSRRLALSVARETVRRRVSALTGAPVAGDVAFAPGLDLGSGPGRIVRDAMFLVAEAQDRGREVFADPLRAANFEETVLNTLLLHHDHSHAALFERRARAPATRDVKRAIDFIEANLDQPLRLGCIVAEAGVSGRALSAHFRDATGLSPMAYLRLARLRAARASLERGEAASVTDAAFRFGFLHLGRFSGAYLEAFGETPSETLARGRRRFSAETG